MFEIFEAIKNLTERIRTLEERESKESRIFIGMGDTSSVISTGQKAIIVPDLYCTIYKVVVITWTAGTFSYTIEKYDDSTGVWASVIVQNLTSLQACQVFSYIFDNDIDFYRLDSTSKLRLRVTACTGVTQASINICLRR
jgi:hypothetical protein